MPMLRDRIGRPGLLGGGRDRETGKTTGATGATTGKTGVVAGQGCSGNRELDPSFAHGALCR
jgi:hypothetical protein